MGWADSITFKASTEAPVSRAFFQHISVVKSVNLPASQFYIILYILNPS